MMIPFFVAIIFAGALAAVFANSLRVSALALWCANLGIGAVYITVGAEELAIVQWIVATLVAVSFISFAAMFGEKEGFEFKQSSRKEVVLFVLAILLGVAFVAVVCLGWESVAPGQQGIPESKNDMLTIGRALTEKHLLSLEVLAFTLFIVLIGGGVIARPEEKESD